MRDNQETNPGLIEARYRSPTNQSTLNIELALSDRQNVSSNPSASSSVGAGISLTGASGSLTDGTSRSSRLCFIGTTPITLPDGDKKYISNIEVGKDRVLAFDPKTGERVPKKVIGKWVHLVSHYLLVKFESGPPTGVTSDHLYWMTRGEFALVGEIPFVWHLDDDRWCERSIIGKKVIKKELLVYNLTVEDFHTYIANGDAVSNLKIE